MSKNRRAGIFYLEVNGEIQDAKGNFTYNLGRPKLEGMPGAARTHGYKETPQVAYCEGEITDAKNLDLNALVTTTDATVTIKLANGKTFVLKEAWYAGDGDVGTEEANIQFRFEGMDADEF